jgi:Rrf2 family protein
VAFFTFGVNVSENTRAEESVLGLEGAEGLRLELSSEGRYGLRALVYLAEAESLVTADRISAEAEIPRRLLARILARLSRAGLVESQEGRGGGSRLARPAGEITLRDAVEAIEGPFGVTRCIMQQRRCGEGRPCALHEAWREGQEAMLRYLEGQTLSEFVSRTASEVSPWATERRQSGA